MSTCLVVGLMRTTFAKTRVREWKRELLLSEQVKTKILIMRLIAD